MHKFPFRQHSIAVGVAWWLSPGHDDDDDDEDDDDDGDDDKDDGGEGDGDDYDDDDWSINLFPLSSHCWVDW